MPTSLLRPAVARLQRTRVPRRSPEMFREIQNCRVCGNQDLIPVLSLGEQYLTGVFPSVRNAALSRGPLELVACDTAANQNACGLVQLRQSYNLDEMYGENYGYRSSLNRAMVKHLRDKVNHLVQRCPLNPGDLVLDIGSNDGTLLSFYPELGVTVAGIDPIVGKFASLYPDHISVIADFFSGDLFRERFGAKKARIVTSIAMFYDLESPLGFMQDVASILAEDGIWHFEMSYLPTMIEKMAYDTICHEHLEYYSLHQIKWMTDRCGLQILDVEFNNVNGGSFAVTVAQEAATTFQPKSAAIEEILLDEERKGLANVMSYKDFTSQVHAHQEELLTLLKKLKEQGKTVLGYGASTKGNVVLQFCGITNELLPCIAEVNSDKFGCFTPGTNIPIVSEKEAREMKPDYFLVLPWHFRDAIILREKEYLRGGGKLIFPLPSLEVFAEP